MKILLSAAILAATLSTSVAANDLRKAKEVTISFDGQCDIFTYNYEATNKFYVSSHSLGCAQAKPIPGIGIVVKKNPGGAAAKQVAVGETITNDDGSLDGYLYAVDYPFVTGGQWILYDTQDGVVVNELAEGTYTITK